MSLSFPACSNDQEGISDAHARAPCLNWVTQVRRPAHAVLTLSTLSRIEQAIRHCVPFRRPHVSTWTAVIALGLVALHQLGRPGYGRRQTRCEPWHGRNPTCHDRYRATFLQSFGRRGGQEVAGGPPYSSRQDGPKLASRTCRQYNKSTEYLTNLHGTAERTNAAESMNQASQTSQTAASRPLPPTAALPGHPYTPPFGFFFMSTSMVRVA